LELNVGPAAPILCVGDLAASLAYFTDALGFRIDWQYPQSIASVSRDRCCIFLCQAGQGRPGSWAWIGVADAGALHDELRPRGARIRQPPTNFPWAREIQVEDLDGNVLRFGSDSLKDQPFGPWLDMHGVRWNYEKGGAWTRESGPEQTHQEPGTPDS
jgi:hypothetical protein